MTLADVTRESVLKAMGEYDEIGAEAFLDRHGFAPSRLYRVTHEGREYDSKAIAGVAHGYATGQNLMASEFSGGQQTVVATLEALNFTFAPAQSASADRRAWLVLTKTEYRRMGGGNKYDDDAESHYSWDSNVANSRNIRVGDAIAVWNQDELIGASVVERIDPTGRKMKPIGHCPFCGTSNYEHRKTLTPKFRCRCKKTFPEPEYTEVEVETFRSTHDQGWIGLEGTLSGPELRALCVERTSQNSIRELRWDDFKAAVESVSPGRPLIVVEATSDQIQGGHTTRPVRVRLGQPAFRAKLIRKYGLNCALTGPAPKEVLEACHLYSYAKVGQHDDEGGLLLRRDLHRLFDEGLVAITKLGTIDVAETIRQYPPYGAIHGQKLSIKLTKRQRNWVRLHWDEWRAAIVG
ncbi:HNH endonuclease [Rhodococcus sp. NPDC127530]|uniref:HNH endonuclease n=1 Tax=unclassified Rhodococcus (in: high G+C Gram-positive bacteria) TaxID=192944 RepID=UPI003634F99E